MPQLLADKSQDTCRPQEFILGNKRPVILFVAKSHSDQGTRKPKCERSLKEAIQYLLTIKCVLKRSECGLLEKVLAWIKASGANLISTQANLGFFMPNYCTIYRILG